MTEIQLRAKLISSIICKAEESDKNVYLTLYFNNYSTDELKEIQGLKPVQYKDEEDTN